MGERIFPVVAFLYFVPILVHLTMDSIKILIDKKFVDHNLSAWATATVAIPCTIAIHLLTGKHWVSPPLAMLCLHFALFSILLNIIRIFAGSLPRKWSSVTYLNSPSDGEQNWWDMVLYPLNWLERLVLWFIIGLVGYTIAFKWECIIHGYEACPELYGLLVLL